MSLFGTMNTAVSGMNAQSNKLSAVGDNIANADTVGYKRTNIQFSTLLLHAGGNSYTSGSVNSLVRHDVSVQGALQSTNSGSDLAIQGKGFFVVQNAAGANSLTRAGSFRLDENGDLINASGFGLMGLNLNFGPAASQINGLSGMERINLSSGGPRAAATTKILIGANLDSRKAVSTAPLPSANTGATTTAPASQFTFKTSVTAYDPLGTEIKYDAYFTKRTEATAGTPGTPATGTTPAVPATPATPATWEVAVFRADRAATGGGFPYSATPTGNTMTLSFDDKGKITTTNPILSITDNVPATPQTISFDFSSISQLATDFTPTQRSVDGKAAATVISASIDKDGTVYAIYSDNTREPKYRIPLADVESPDNLTPRAGNVYTPSTESGVTFTGFPGDGHFGVTLSNSLEMSNVDMATELTDMIQAQRNYTANSKVFQTGSELMDLLTNLKR